MSARNLSRQFKKSTGLTVKQFADRVRLGLARHLMFDPGMTVEAISRECGYKDARQFRRVWKEGCLRHLSVGGMTLRLFGAMNYNQISARHLRCAPKSGLSAFLARGYVRITNSRRRKHPYRASWSSGISRSRSRNAAHTGRPDILHSMPRRVSERAIGREVFGPTFRL